MLFPKSLFSLISCRICAVLGYLFFPSLHWLSVPRCYYTKTIQQCSFPFMCYHWQSLYFLCYSFTFYSSSLSVIQPTLLNFVHSNSLQIPDIYSFTSNTWENFSTILYAVAKIFCWLMLFLIYCVSHLFFCKCSTFFSYRVDLFVLVTLTQHFGSKNHII